ncbi:hypothetical protein Tcan_14594 [Toxocara canis]|uniref:Uncharacterized protein n=1 Tax=Toxocara canis TaxID=6265 RepID=A0A0B2VS53_TOXCA|nr:hypothetical protein Tcan_14594 [Toxocara canis]
MASDANSNSSSSNSSSGKPHSSTISTSKSSNTTTSQTTTTTNSTTNSTSNTSSDSQQSTTQYNASGTPSCGQSNAVAHSTSSCNSSSSFSIVSGSGSSSGPNNQPVHPRPIQPRPVVEAKTNYEALVKSYTLNGVNKFAAFALDGKQAKSFAAHAMHVQSSIFLDPKLASQPIKQVLSGRGMPLMPEAAPYLRPPSAQIASFMQHFHMQSFQGGLGPTSSPIMHSNGSAPPSAPPTPSHLAVSQSPPTQISQLKLPTVSTGSADAGKLLGKTSPVPKIQQKIGASLPIPTAHITPFMSQS